MFRHYVFECLGPKTDDIRPYLLRGDFERILEHSVVRVQEVYEFLFRDSYIGVTC